MKKEMEKYFEYDKHGNKVVKRHRVGNFEFRASYPLFRNYEKSDVYYEIVKWEKNKYYGNEDLYEFHPGKQEGEGYYTEKNSEYDFHRIHESCFKNPETCYSVLHFTYDEREPCYETKSVGSRIVTSCDNDQEVLDLHNVIDYGFEMLSCLSRAESGYDDYDD